MAVLPVPWQDVVFTLGNLVFAFSLVGTALDKEAEVPRITSVPTGFFLYLFVVAFFSLDLPFSAFTSGLSAVMWTFVAIQRAPPRGHSIMGSDSYFSGD